MSAGADELARAAASSKSMPFPPAHLARSPARMLFSTSVIGSMDFGGVRLAHRPRKLSRYGPSFARPCTGNYPSDTYARGKGENVTIAFYAYRAEVRTHDLENARFVSVRGCGNKTRSRLS